MSAMLNQTPIFLNCFSRGGSNILWNIFLTHPDVCSPIYETLELFRIGRRGRWAGYRAILLTGQVRFFDQKNLEARRPISNAAQVFIDQTLYDWKLKTYDDQEMRFKYEDHMYTRDEVRQARLVAKNNNGLIFLTDRLLEIYPRAAFIGLTRHPLALFESYKRRKFITSPGSFVDFYTRMTGHMLEERGVIESYQIIRFEDILSDLTNSIDRLYAWTNLDRDKVSKLRLKAKAHIQADGTHDSDYQIGVHHWLPIAETANDFLETGINQYQIDRLDTAEKQFILDGTHDVREQLGYGEGLNE